MSISIGMSLALGAGGGPTAPFSVSIGSGPVITGTLMTAVVSGAAGGSLGANLVTDGGFDIGISEFSSGGSAILSHENGKLRVAGAFSPFPYAYTAVTTEIGKTYVVSVDATFVSGTDGGVYVDKSDAALSAINRERTGEHAAADLPTLEFTATATTTYIHLGTNNGNDVNDWDNVSVRETGVYDYQWTDDGANITGATASTYTAEIGTDSVADASLIRCVVTVDGEPYTSNARQIQYAAGTAPAVADGQSFTVDDTSVNIDGSASGANLTFSYVLTGAPSGVTINASTGAITGTPDTASTGTATITATDQYGRTLTDAWTWTAALRTQATAAGGLGPYSFTQDAAITNQDLSADFTANGNTLTYTVSPALPAGLSLASNGVLSGTPTTPQTASSYTVTGQDEYGRDTDSTFTIAVVAAASFTPADLFASGEEGVWLEPSTSTAFLSATDLTPCAVGDECGFLLDKSQGAGYSGGSFTGLGSEGAPALSTYATVLTGTWSDAGGGAYSFEDTVGGQTRPGVQWASSGLVSGTLYLASISVDSITGAAQLRVDGVGSDVLIGAGAHDFVFTADATSASQGLRVRIEDVSTTLGDGFTISSISVRELPGNHATQDTIAARPILRQTGGGLYYLEFDGTDDGMETAAIDFTATDKMSIFAGVTKNGDSAGMITELSDDYGFNTGSFFLISENLYGSPARGGARADPGMRANTSTVSGADTAVITALHDIPGDSSIIRRNGVASSPATADKGLGNFKTYPLYIGARGGSSFFFSGDLYSLIIRGATTSGDDLTNTESYVADKTGVTL